MLMFICLCMFACLFVCVTKHCSGIGFNTGSHLPIYTKPRGLLLGALLVGICVIHTQLWWLYGHNPNLHWLHICLYMSLCLFVCLPACFLILYVFVICVSFACFLCLFVLYSACLFVLYLVDEACTPTSKKQAKGFD